MGKKSAPPTSGTLQFGNPLNAGSEDSDGDDGQPMSHSRDGTLEPEQPAASPTAGKGKKPKKLKKISSVDLSARSSDIESAVASGISTGQNALAAGISTGQNALASGISTGLSIVGRKTADDENAMPTPDPKVTEDMLRVAFDKIDKDASRELDKEEVRLAAAEVGASWNDNQLQQVFNFMDDDGNANGFVVSRVLTLQRTRVQHSADARNECIGL
jgi:hypothetical protein